MSVSRGQLGNNYGSTTVGGNAATGIAITTGGAITGPALVNFGTVAGGSVGDVTDNSNVANNYSSNEVGGNVAIGIAAVTSGGQHQRAVDCELRHDCRWQHWQCDSGNSQVGNYRQQ